ncbi:hypothetical protein RZS08_64990, partial [Arthrospira platensis SPKY1]|nr:hypothetical protein [Arthrospira platensis SPKY1]
AVLSEGRYNQMDRPRSAGGATLHEPGPGCHGSQGDGWDQGPAQFIWAARGVTRRILTRPAWSLVLSTL